MRLGCAACESPGFALALCGAPAAVAAAQVELTPAWGGWSRPGRVTEVAVRVRADAATRGSRRDRRGSPVRPRAVDLAAGDARLLEVPVSSVATLAS